MSARDTALSALIACRKQGAWSDGVLKTYIARDRLDRRDAALASRLCYGVLQNRMLLDFYIGSFLHGSLGRLQPVVLDILRLGTFQLLMTDRIPDSAAVNEAVEQAKRHANRQAGGLVNGVLRTVIRNRDALPQPKDLATRYSHPQPLVDLLAENVGAELLEPLLRAHNTVPPMAVQVNTVRTDAQTLQRMLQEQGVTCTVHPWLKDCLLISGTGNVEQLSAYREGLFYVQDPAARLAVVCAGVQPDMQVLDCCAAPGGKSFACAAAMENRGQIFSCDIHAHKVGLIENGARRLGFDRIAPMLQDAAEYNPAWQEQMDVVLADVPCSGLGVIRKKPDIRYKDLGQTERLPQIQSAILENQARYVRRGGVLLYSTCTILRRENEAVIERFLSAHEEFSLETLPLPEQLNLKNSGMATLLPCLHETDGFFICKLRRHF